MKGTTGSSAGAFMMITAHALCAMINISSGVCVHGVARHAHRYAYSGLLCISPLSLAYIGLNGSLRYTLELGALPHNYRLLLSPCL